MEEWLVMHPRAIRACSMGLVVIGTMFFIKLIRRDAEIGWKLKLASDKAHEASEALGG